MIENKELERITLKYIWEEIKSVLNFEKGLSYTFLEFLIRPGKSTYRFLFEDRKIFMGPFKYAFLAVSIYSFISLYFVKMDIAAPLPEMDQSEVIALESQRVFKNVMAKYSNLIMFVSIPFTAILTYLFFMEKKWFYTEHVTINMYYLGTATFFSIPIIILAPFFPNVYAVLIVLITAVYQIFVYKKTFKITWFTSIWKGILISFLSSFIFMMGTMFVIGIYVGYQLAVNGALN